MKQEIKFSAFCLVALVLFFSCKKETQIIPPPLKAKTVKARVIEYGSDLPIAGAIVSICTTAFYNQNGYYECAGNYLNFRTDTNGEFFFKTEGLYRFEDGIGIIKDGYFNLDEPNSGCLFEDDYPYTSGQINKADSFTVRKVPITYATIHIKSISPNNFPVVISGRGLLSSRLPALQNLQCRSIIGSIFNLGVEIDTIFQYPVFGDADNEFIISNSIDNDSGAPIGEIMRTVRFIPKTSNDTVEINF